MSVLLPMPLNEFERVLSLAELDLDYNDLNDNFKDLSRLAAKIAGTEISVINLLDLHTQWTISSFGIDRDQTPREETVCQYAIAQDECFEIKDLSVDKRVNSKQFVLNNPNLRYYCGIPLRSTDGHNIGALCVLDKEIKHLPPEKTEMLKIIADEIVTRLNAIKVINSLKHRIEEANESKKRVAHDIRGPLGGIIGLAQVIAEQGHDNQIEEVLEFINLIQKSGKSLLELADEILSIDAPKKNRALTADEFNQVVLKDKLEKLYRPQAVNKKINFSIITSSETETIPFSKNKLLQIIGNLISNSMKFTPAGGTITVKLNLVNTESAYNKLTITVYDTGIGMDSTTIAHIMGGHGNSTNGTNGEHGYGFGLPLVKHLVDSLKGTMHISSIKDEGTVFYISLPQPKS